jgi:hypothetical protein
LKHRKGLKSLAKDEVAKLVQDLVLYGKDFPALPGLGRSLVPVAPSAMRVVLSYGFNVSITGAAGEVDSYQFAGNGMFDPDVTGGAGQPLGFDQWHAFYNRNRVLASSIELVVTTPDATVNDQGILEGCLFPSNSSSLPSSIGAGRSMPYSRANTFNSISRLQRFEHSMETSLVMGIPRAAVLIDDNLTGTLSANPSELWYWTFQVQPTDQAAATTYRVTGTIHYLVDFFDKNLFALSAGGAAKKGKRTSLKKD